MKAFPARQLAISMMEHGSFNMKYLTGSAFEHMVPAGVADGKQLESYWKRDNIGEFLSMGSATPATNWTNNTAVNESVYNQYLNRSTYGTMFYTLNILTVIVSLVGLVGNAIVLFLLGFCMHRNTFSVYILNLAVADFLFLCFETLYSLEKHFDVHGIYIGIPISLNILLNFAYLAGLSMLTAISAERCLSVVCPIWYRCRRPRHTSTVMCALLWVLSLLLSLLEGKACGWLYGFDYGWCMKLDFITFAWLIVLIVVLLGSTLTLLIRIFCDSRRIPVTRLYVTIAFTVLVFLLFGLSYGIYWFFLFWTGVVFICNVFEMSSFLSCVNSCANPIIYFLVGSLGVTGYNSRL